MNKDSPNRPRIYFKKKNYNISWGPKCNIQTGGLRNHRFPQCHIPVIFIISWCVGYRYESFLRCWANCAHFQISFFALCYCSSSILQRYFSAKPAILFKWTFYSSLLFNTNCSRHLKNLHKYALIISLYTPGCSVFI